MQDRADGGPAPAGGPGQTTRLVRTSSSDPPPEDVTERRWRRRPWLAALVRAVVVLGPLAASVAAGVLASRAFRPHGLWPTVGWLAWTAVVSIAVLAVVDAAARRLLPLQRLLQLCLVFPDRAPSRLRVAVQAARPRRPEALLAAPVPGASRAQEAAAHIVRLLAALSVHDRRTRGHSERVCAYTELLAEQMNLDRADRDRLMWVALVHDIGKLDVPRRLLNKPGRPTVSEWHVLQAHPERGAALTAGLRDWLGDWADAVVQHHERFDGHGYPHGLRGAQISLGGRILAVTDAFEVMTAPRAYRRPVDAQSARAELARYAGAQFDPDIVRHFLAVGLPKLRRAMGLLAWLGQLPFIRQWPRLQSQLSPAATQAATSAVVASSLAAVALGAGAVPVPAAAAPEAAPPRATGSFSDHAAPQPTPGPREKPGSGSAAGGSRRAGAEAGHAHGLQQTLSAGGATAKAETTRDSTANAAEPAPEKGSRGRHLGWTLAPQRRAHQANARAAGPHRH